LWWPRLGLNITAKENKIVMHTLSWLVRYNLF
jgi:hypothetical protein